MLCAVFRARAGIVRGSSMGRGRQKAKHTKVARELKYFSPDTNYNALQRELTHASATQPDYVDKWADDADDDQEGADELETDDELDDESDADAAPQSRSA